MIAALIVVGVFAAFFGFWRWLERPMPEPFPCPVCGAPDRNCYGRMTSACGVRR